MFNRVFLFFLPALAAVVLWLPAAEAQWYMPARQVSTQTNSWTYIPQDKVTAQLVFNWLDGFLADLALDGSSWTNLPATNSLQDVLDWVDENWSSDIIGTVTSQWPFLDTDYRDDLTNITFSAADDNTWGFTYSTNGTGEIQMPASLLTLGSGTVSQAFFDAVGVNTQSLSGSGFADVTNYQVIAAGSVGTFSGGTLTITNAGTYAFVYQGIIYRDGASGGFSIDPYMSFSGNEYQGTYVGASANFRVSNPSENGMLVTGVRTLTNGETATARLYVETACKLKSSRMQFIRIQD